ncbi:putative phage abortive infection protein [Stutzerimonas frequens]|uniref:Phage abortive infection protein n=1 Tax=Stutzerimonas frequens TaxID=2968969 RepID=A0AA47E419_9GAMM|nr:putative phage abortive infection protein [Stutzerimonas frequens]WAE53781.1 putative phage abortive infection protein [Stutzerimonas frequens]
MTIGTSNFGEWGDFFGGVLNPILTFLTFMGLLITIVIQQTELRESRSELKRSADALLEQAKNARKQNFESTFFKMLDTHSGIIESIDLAGINGNTTRGRDCFTTFYKRLQTKYNKRMLMTDKDKDLKALYSTYEEFWLEHQHELGHYFRFLYNIIRFIKESDLQDGLYIRLIRAQLSDQELLLIFYNCIASEHGERFKPLVEEFALLDNMPTVRVLSDEHLSLIDRAAFGGQHIEVNPKL